MRKVILKQK